MSRPISAGQIAIGTGGPATWGGKLLISQSASSLPMASGSNASKAGEAAFGSYSNKKLSLGKSAVSSLKDRAIADVRALGKEEEPLDQTMSASMNSHDKLMSGLKSRSARVDAESSKDFLAVYRSATGADRASGNAAQQDAQLDALIRTAADRSETLRRQNVQLNEELMQAKERMDHFNTAEIAKASDQELQGCSRFERSQRKINEDKLEEELQKKRDDAQSKYTKIQRQMQGELTELRDYMLLLQEYRGLRLQKLGDTLLHTRTGTQLRSIVRQMLRHGATRMTQKLESAVPELEPWMREVVVNMCHVEIQIEDGERQLLQMRRTGVQPVEGQIDHMRAHGQGDRVDRLFAATWSAMQDIRMEHHLELVGGLEEQFGNPALASMVSEDGQPLLSSPDQSAPRQYAMPKNLAHHREATKKELMPPSTVHALADAEAEVLAKRTLLADMRQNVASVVCNRMHQEGKRSGNSAKSKQWAQYMISLMVAQSFAKTTMKAVEKAAPQGKLGN